MESSDRFDEIFIIVAPLVPIIVGLSTWQFSFWIHRPSSYVELSLGFGAAALVTLALLGLVWVLILRRFKRSMDYNLGFYGERYVAQFLYPLMREGYYVYHDFEIQAQGKPVNIDHILVGPAGVFVVETKTRRKRKGRPGYKEHEVKYNGKYFDFPWGTDSYGINQAQANAKSLKRLLEGATQLKSIPVYSVLTLPGWMISQKEDFKNPAVVSPKSIQRYISRQPNHPAMDTPVIGQLAFVIEERNKIKG